jgi:SRSO17 transposase
VAYRLYLPKNWAEDNERRCKAGIPEEIGFKTKPEIALEQIQWACETDLPGDLVVIDAGYGNASKLRAGITEKYWLSTLPRNISFCDLVDTAKLRWRIERDYQELKQEVGLGHFERRGWRGFHHHATLCIAAYGFLVSERETIPPPSGPHSGGLFGSSVSLVRARIDHSRQLAGRHTRSVTTVPAKQHDKRQRDEGEKGDRDGRAAGHSI